MNHFKIFPRIKFDNIKTLAMIEHDIQPLELIINVSFSVTPTRKSQIQFDNNIGEFVKYIYKNKLGRNAICKNITFFNKFNWNLDSWCGISYTYEHDLSEMQFNNKSNFGIDFLLKIPHKNYSKKVYNEIHEQYSEVAKHISKLENFNSDRYLTVVSSRK